MLNISENITVTGNVTIDNRVIVNMAANVVIEENTYPNISMLIRIILKLASKVF